MGITRRTVLVAFAAAAALAGVAGVAYATIPDSGGVIHGCYATKDGSLRVIDPSSGQGCAQKESPVDWNAQGPEGPAGPQGPTGPQGPAGSTHGYQTIGTASITCCHVATVLSLGGLPDGAYMVWAQINAFGSTGDRVYCSLNGTNVPGYTVEDDLPNGTADPVIVSAASLSGGGNNNKVDVQCEAGGSAMTTYAEMSLIPVAALN